MNWIQEHWEFFAVSGIAVIGIVLAFLASYWWQRSVKRLDYSVLTLVPLLAPNQSARLNHNLGVIYDGQPVDSPHLVTVRIKNTGKQPVMRTEYVQPITVFFERGAVLDGLVIDESSPGLV